MTSIMAITNVGNINCQSSRLIFKYAFNKNIAHWMYTRINAGEILEFLNELW